VIQAYLPVRSGCVRLQGVLGDSGTRQTDGPTSGRCGSQFLRQCGRVSRGGSVSHAHGACDGVSLVAALGVPTPYRRVYTWIRDLGNEDAVRLTRALDAAPAYQRANALRDSAREALGDAADIDFDLLIPALLSLRAQLRGKAGMSVAEALSKSSDLDTGTEEQRLRLRDRVAELLDTEAIVTTANAIALLTEHDRNFHAARILTDIRPVFGDDVEARPTGAVIVEMLNIETWSRSGTADSLYIAMDETDLLDLREQVDRAIKKTQAMKETLEASKITYFELDEDDL